MIEPAVGPRGTRPRVLVGRAEHQAESLATLLEAAGCRPVCVPLVTIEPAQDDGAALDAAVAAFVAGRHDVVAFTSGNAVKAFAASLGSHGAAGRAALRERTLACVGPATAAALRARLDARADLVAAVHTGAGLAATLVDSPPVARPSGTGAVGSPPPPHVLVPRSSRASQVLPDALRAAGWAVHDVTAYRTVPIDRVPVDVAAGLVDGTIDVVTVTSPSAVAGLVAAVGADVRALVVAIGPVTAAAARRAGLSVAATADPHTAAGVVAAVLDIV